MRQVAKTSRNFFGETFAVLGAALSVSAAVRIPEHLVLGGRYKLRFCWRILCV